ncbi:MAG: hypothetical protein HDR77_11210 [Bacteroides sp.]|nr:hypothetical protein [Bacteroides sp.]MBD5376022.1 hypothetical protein [Bacteroides sp.]
MKRLLILGGTNISLQILHAAKELGLEVYVADYLSDSPCKVFADKSFNISATDVDAICKLISTEHIDGVLMGYADVLLKPYIEICSRVGLPCYANKTAIEITSDKRKFKDYCRRFNIPVIPEYSFESIIRGEKPFPIIIKPVDNSGARGIYICNNIPEFKQFYLEALNYSPSKTIIIEPLLNEKEATIFYFIKRGIPYLLGVGDRLMYEQDSNIIKLPVGYIFPSKSIDSFIKNQDYKFRQLFSSLSMNDGMVFIQTFLKNDQYIVYEMGYRLTGSIEHHLIDRQYSFNHLKEMIHFAVGEDTSDETLTKIDPKKCCMANISLLLREGIIQRYEGLENLKSMPEVVHYHVSYDIGTVIDQNIIGKLAQVGIRILLVAQNKIELLQKMDEIKNTLSVIDTTGKDMIIKDYSYQIIAES